MDNRATDFINFHLAANGFVIASSRLAGHVNPGLYGSGQNALALEGESIANELRLLGCRPYRVVFESGESVKCWSRHPGNMAQRIEWLTGADVAQVTPMEDVKPTTTSAPTFKQAEREHTKAERLAYLKKLAEQEPPAHDCSLRREILAARQELGVE